MSTQYLIAAICRLKTAVVVSISESDRPTVSDLEIGSTVVRIPAPLSACPSLSLIFPLQIGTKM